MKRFTQFAAVLSLLAFAACPAFASFGASANDTPSQPLRWKQGTVQIAVSTSLIRQNPNIKYDSDVAGAIRRSFQTWQRYVDIDLQEVSSEKQSISPSGLRGDGINLITIAQTPENILFFSKGLEESAAATRVFYDKRGLVTEADIALNPFQQFSTDGTIGTFDLESTLTHEIGHLLGLEHSDVLGATMHEKYGKNGAYGLSSFSARTLSQDDIAAVRRLYGSKNDRDACCGRIAGKLAAADGKPRSWQVWAEDPVSGQVRSEIAAGTDGSFKLDGLSGGTFALFAQERANGFPTRDGRIGDFAASSNETNALNKKISTGKGNFRLEFLGFNGQLSDIAVSVNPGKTYTIYLGGKNLDPKVITAGFTSPFLTVVPNSLQSVDFGSDVSVLSFDMRVDADTPVGDYSVFAQTESGLRRYIVGGITVEEFLNPFAKFGTNFD